MKHSEGIMTQEPTDLNMISLSLKSTDRGDKMAEPIALLGKGSEANAERIVTTWNAYDELVHNLKITVKTLEFYDTNDNAGMRKEAIRIAKNLLKSLEK